MKFISRLFSESAIQIRGGTAYCVKGKIMNRLLNDLSSLAADFNINKGEIWIDQVGKVSFSTDLPKTMHQKIRNVISSH
jgi:hypothetical protein